MKTKDKFIVVLLIALALALLIGGRMRANHQEFTKEKWENYTGNSRQLILDSFVDRTTVKGLTKDGVKELLGEPDEETENFMTYFLGMPRGFFGTKAEGEDEYLLFSFTDEKVSKLEKLGESFLPKESKFREIPQIGEGNVLYPEGKGGDQ